MKRRNRYRFCLNIFALSLLAVALYLNFVKKEATESDAAPVVHENVLNTKPTAASNAKAPSSIDLTVVLK